MTTMNERKSEKAAVMTFADHEVITPPNRLRRAVKVAGANESPDDPVARAEQALAELAAEFSGWMEAEVERLDRARYVIKVHGFTKASLEALFHAAHDIKGQAATFGFPHVAPAADSLCRLIEHTPEKERIPVTLVEQHVDAVRAILREHARPDSAAVADALSHRLREVTEEFLNYENRDNPDFLDGILAPPIVPGEPAA
jgi:chemotaxis protein histidine kinase CheA